MSKLLALFRVLKAGHKMVDSVKTKKRAIWTNSIVAFLGAVVTLGVAAGVDLGITIEQIKAAGEALGAIVGAGVTLYGLYNAWQTAATSETVGVREKRSPTPELLRSGEGPGDRPEVWPWPRADSGQAGTGTRVRRKTRRFIPPERKRDNDPRGSFDADDI